MAPSMARWAGFGEQIAAAIERQGGEVEHYYMNGTPHMLSRNRELSQKTPLSQVLAGKTEPTVVVVSDGSAFDSLRARAKARWLGFPCTAWLHPASVDTWGPGARWLAGLIPVVPMTESGLLRLGSPHQGRGGVGLPRWQTAVVLGKAARTANLRAALSEPAFWWLAAGAVLDRTGALTMDLWWALRDQELTPASADQVSRVLGLDDVRVGADGTVRIAAALREELVALLQKERPELLSKVVAWAEKIITADLKRLEARSLAAVNARAMRAALLLTDASRQRAARRQIRRIARDGFGEWVQSVSSPEETAAPGRLRLTRAQPPGPWFKACVAICLLVMSLSMTLFMSTELRERLIPEPSPTTPPSATPTKSVIPSATPTPSRKPPPTDPRCQAGGVGASYCSISCDDDACEVTCSSGYACCTCYQKADCFCIPN
jgi:hypothetical protein